MPDNSIRLQATFDKSQLTAAFEASKGDAQAFMDALGVSFEQGKAKSQKAFRSISDDVKEMAKTVSGENLKIAEATRELAQANADVRRSFVLVKDGTRDAEESQQLYAAALERARVATMKLAETEAALGGASHKAVSDVQATSAAIRTLEGNAGLRAMENFVAKTLGLGPAMAAIFPIIGALAFGRIIFDMGEKIYEIGNKAAHAAESIREAFSDLHEKAQVTNDDLAIQNDKLQDEIDKLSGRPNNGLQTALDEARKMADKLSESLQEDRKQLAALLKEHEVTAFGTTLSGVASTGRQASELTADQKELTNAVRAANDEFDEAIAKASNPAQIKAATDKKNEAVRRAYQDQIATYKIEAGRLKKEQDDSLTDASTQGEAAGNAVVIDNSAKIANIEGRAQQLQDALRREQLSESIAGREQTVGGLKQGKENAGGENKAAEQRFKAMEEELNEEKLLHSMTVKEVYDFWDARRDAFTKGSEQYAQVTAKMATEAVAGSRAAGEAIKKYKAEQLKDEIAGDAAAAKSAKGMEEWQQKTAANILMTSDAWNSYFSEITKGREIQSGIDEAIQEGKLKSMESTGAITALGFAQAEAALHAELHRQKLQELREELKRLEAAAKRDPVTGNVTDPKQASQIQGVKNQITTETGKSSTQGAQDSAAVAAAMAAPYLKAFNTIENGWMSAQRAMLTGQKSFSMAMKQMGDNLALDAIQNSEKAVFNFLKNEMKKEAAHAATIAAGKAMDAEGASFSVAADALAALKKMNHAAAVAAGKAWSAFADIPIVGPELGAVAAGATYAGVMALASFDTGTMQVPHDGLAMIHKNESILPPPQTAVLRDALNGNTSGGDGGEMHLHLGQNNFSQAGEDFKSQWAAHERHIVGRLHELKRDGVLKLGG